MNSIAVSAYFVGAGGQFVSKKFKRCLRRRADRSNITTTHERTIRFAWHKTPGKHAGLAWERSGIHAGSPAGTDGDVVDGGAGNDIVIASAGDDRVQGGLGDDQIDGMGGGDVLEGGDGQDSINGDGLLKTGYLNSAAAALHGAEMTQTIAIESIVAFAHSTGATGLSLDKDTVVVKVGNDSAWRIAA